mmetsp:Transcript_31569/g.102103  ORF Transcript_31569/g.102103 Transcript_31569/m.102103 type:complete len:313 (-) Transcript_31569:97-1035(-)
MRHRESRASPHARLESRLEPLEERDVAPALEPLLGTQEPLRLEPARVRLGREHQGKKERPHAATASRSLIVSPFWSTLPFCAASAIVRSSEQPSARFSYANMPEPAMKQLAPASAHAAIVQSALTPPSTSMSMSRPRSTIQPRIFLILSTIVGMYAWPPKPGLTVITSTWSHRSSTFSIISAGVCGLSATDGEPPPSRILVSVRCRCVFPSTCAITTPGLPGWLVAAVYSSSIVSQLYCDTISCVSNLTVVYFLQAAMSSGPKVRFGTKLPSMTSNWIRSTPASSSRLHSAPMLAQSAGRTDGMIWTGLGSP